MVRGQELSPVSPTLDIVAPSRATDRAHARAGGLGVRERDGYRGGHQLFPRDLCRPGEETRFNPGSSGCAWGWWTRDPNRGPTLVSRGGAASAASYYSICEAVPPRSLFCEASCGKAATGMEVFQLPRTTRPSTESISPPSPKKRGFGGVPRAGHGARGPVRAANSPPTPAHTPSYARSSRTGRSCRPRNPRRARRVAHLPSMIRSGSSVIAGMYVMSTSANRLMIRNGTTPR